ncbi:hypothetical protein, partial [Providencia rettgeri]|uniref:hypothetical protein n=1 Tax=Providencia rettgeri TaxID=587 RepID=UPI001B38C2B2
MSSIIAIILVLSNRKKRKNLTILLRQKFLYTSMSIYLAFIILGLFSTIFNQSYDFTINRTLINNILSLFCCLFFAILILEKPSVEKQFSIILIIQSLIIITMILSPDIRSLIQDNIRSDSEMERLSTYGGVRGLGLSGSIAFGLAATMGLLGYIFFYWG